MLRVKFECFSPVPPNGVSNAALTIYDPPIDILEVALRFNAV